jgi:uncharacterized protein YbaP (TraB family)
LINVDVTVMTFPSAPHQLTRRVISKGARWCRLAIAAAAASALVACTAESSRSQESSPTFLWQIESPTNTVYLLGSIHFLAAADHPLPDAMLDAFDEAEGIVFEVDLSLAQAPSAAQTLLQRAQPDQPEERLAVALSPETYALAEQSAVEFGLPINLFQNFEPWFFALSILPLQLQSLGFEAEYGVDQYFFTLAQDQAKETLYLETLDYQLSLFDQLSIPQQEEFLLQTLEGIDIMAEALDALVSTWLTGDVDGFETLILASFEDYPELEETLLTQRNLNWLSTLEGLIGGNQDYLVIVGAGHLVGDAGLVALLTDQGYVVEQVPQP